MSFNSQSCAGLNQDLKQGHELVFEWNLENFTHLPKYEYSKETCASNACRVKTLWRTEVHFFESPRRPKSIELYVKLHRTDKRESSVKAEFKIFLTNNIEEIIFEGACGSMFPAENTFRSTSVTMWLTNQAFFSLPDNELKLRIVVTISGCCDESTFLEDVLKAKGGKIVEEHRDRSLNVHLSQLQKDFRQAYQSNLLSDVELSSGDKTVCVSKFILSARSPVFRNLFQDTQVTKVNLGSAYKDDQSIEAFVSYLYTGFSSNLSLNTTTSLYSLASTYEVTNLKNICGHILFANVNVNTVIGVLKLADRHKDGALKEACMRFIADCMGLVQRTPHWNSFVEKYPMLHSEVCHFLLNY